MNTTKQQSKETALKPPCEKCGAKCCKYVAVEIDKPVCKTDYDNIRWYLLHNNVAVFVDYDNKWYIEFSTKCSKLDKSNKCSIYNRRPKICRIHGNKDTPCEYFDNPDKMRFTTEKQFIKYLNSKNIDWQWKNLK
jgi:uncharacterized protein